MEDQSQLQDTYTPNPPLSRLKGFFSKNKYIVIAISLLAIASFGSTGYLLIANKQSSPNRSIQESPFIGTVPTVAPMKEVTPPTETPTPTPTPIVLTEETATWSAFLSEKYDYSLKYPPDWTATISAQTDPKILEYVIFNPKEATESGALSITLSYGTRTYDEALAVDSTEGEVIFVASVSATKKNLQDSDGNKSTSVIIPVDVNTIVINAKEAYTNILDLMLDTLKL